MKKRALGLCILFFTILCVGGCGKKKNEIEILIQNYQEAINAGLFEKADGYCQLADGQRGTFHLSDYFAVNDKDDAYIAASKQLYLESIEVDVDSVEIDGDDAIAYVTVTNLDVIRFVNSFPDKYEIEQLTNCSVDECKKMLEADAKYYKYSSDAKIICKKIDNQWKITEFI